METLIDNVIANLASDLQRIERIPFWKRYMNERIADIRAESRFTSQDLAWFKRPL